MTDKFTSAFIELTTTNETDIYQSTESNQVIVNIRITNVTNGGVTVEMWVTDGLDVHCGNLIPPNTVIEAYGGLEDSFKIALPLNYKIRATADTADAIFVTTTVML
ncbi:MAG: hypothetical protein M0R80_10005 [Proteobacteria bacterium]|jgi:hypothetical protein|nr:hypothetical protein [Pseudomonadota bacterium]